MSAWIKMRVDLHMDPRIMRVAELTGLDVFAVVGRVHMLWSWISTQTLDGNARCVTRAHVDHVCAHEGFAKALERVGWLIVDEGSDRPGEEEEPSISIPNWDHHNSQTARSRALTANRVRKNRVTPPLRSRNADVTQGALPEKRREEKRRKENHHPLTPSEPQAETEATDGASDPDAAAAVVFSFRDEQGKADAGLVGESLTVARELATMLGDPHLDRAAPFVRRDGPKFIRELMAYTIAQKPRDPGAYILHLLETRARPTVVQKPGGTGKTAAEVLAEMQKAESKLQKGESA